MGMKKSWWHKTNICVNSVPLSLTNVLGKRSNKIFQGLDQAITLGLAEWTSDWLSVGAIPVSEITRSEFYNADCYQCKRDP